MNLNTVTALRQPASAAEISEWRDGYAWLAGGTWLLSEPQPATDTLIDLGHFDWPVLEASPAGLEIGATCRIAELYRFETPREWIAAPLIRACCDALLASFKIWNGATVGGNICMSLPAGAIISLVVALEGWCTLWPRRSAAGNSGGRLCDRQPRQRAASRRITAQDSST
jgi:CO/xanthine dehydrogenase FAD-binding subunit